MWSILKSPYLLYQVHFFTLPGSFLYSTRFISSLYQVQVFTVATSSINLTPTGNLDLENGGWIKMATSLKPRRFNHGEIKSDTPITNEIPLSAIVSIAEESPATISDDGARGCS